MWEGGELVGVKDGLDLVGVGWGEDTLVEGISKGKNITVLIYMVDMRMRMDSVRGGVCI